MINQYKGSDLKIYNGVGVLEYYSLNGLSEWAFLAYSALTFVFFFFVAYLVSPYPPQTNSLTDHEEGAARFWCEEDREICELGFS